MEFFYYKLQVIVLEHKKLVTYTLDLPDFLNDDMFIDDTQIGFRKSILGLGIVQGDPGGKLISFISKKLEKDSHVYLNQDECRRTEGITHNCVSIHSICVVKQFYKKPASRFKEHNDRMNEKFLKNSLGLPEWSEIYPEKSGLDLLDG